MAARLRNVLLLQRDVERAVEFYSQGLGLSVIVQTHTYAELALGYQQPPLALLQRDNEAVLSCGYSPLLHFTVDDVDETVKQLVLRGASLDGPVKHPAQGKTASLRAPDGHMLGLSSVPPSASDAHSAASESIVSR